MYRCVSLCRTLLETESDRRRVWIALDVESWWTVKFQLFELRERGECVCLDRGRVCVRSGLREKVRDLESLHHH